MVTDSADIEFVDVAAAVIDTLPQWTFSAEPMLTIGKTTGEDPYLFARIQDAFRLRSGETVVLEGFDFEFRIFDSGGLFRGSFGGRGEGPGEFGEVVGLRERTEGGIASADNRCGGVTCSISIRAWCPHIRRRSVLPMAGTTMMFRSVTSGLTPRCAVFWYGSRRARGLPRINEGTVQRTPGGTLFLALASGDSTLVVDSVSARGHVRIVQSLNGTPAIWSIPEIFAPEGHWAFGPRSVALGESSGFEIRLRDPR